RRDTRTLLDLRQYNRRRLPRIARRVAGRERKAAYDPHTGDRLDASLAPCQAGDRLPLASVRPQQGLPEPPVCIRLQHHLWGRPERAPTLFAGWRSGRGTPRPADSLAGSEVADLAAHLASATLALRSWVRLRTPR